MKTDREKLIDFKSWCKENCTRNLYEGIELAINNYEKEKSINKALDETKTVNNNEHQKKICIDKAGGNDLFNTEIDKLCDCGSGECEQID